MNIGGGLNIFFKLAIIFQFSLLIYFEITTLVNLYPWNDLSKYSRKDKLLESIVNGLIIILGVGLFITKVKLLMIIATVFWFFYFLMQLLTWWMPYLMGKHLKQFPKSLYETHFKNTIKILPAKKDHIIPDAQHNVLQLLSLVTFILCLISLFD